MRHARLPAAAALLLPTALAAAAAAHASPLDPTAAARTGHPNDALACPPGACAGKPDLPSPELPIPPDAAFAALREVVAGTPRMTVVAADAAARTLQAEQRSRVFRFVDDVAAKVLPAAGGRSAVAIYSRSRLGRYDFGVNRRRVRTLTEALQRRFAGG